MPWTDLGACELFVSNLRLSDLLDDTQVDEAVGGFLAGYPGAQPDDLAQHLVTSGVLTHFQAKALLRDKSPDLVVGPYVLIDVMGTGSMGTVYKSQCKSNNRFYAVKVLPRRDIWNISRVRQLAHDFERIRHPGVIPFADVGTARGLHYLAWPLVEGESLDRLVERQGKVQPPLAALYALQAAEALEVCHQNGITHGLVKPSNLILGPDRRIRLLDLGVSLLLLEGESSVHTMGKASVLASQLNCASPETIADWSGLTPLSDQYSLGCVLYFLLTNKYPFEGKTFSDKLRAHQREQPPPLRNACPEAAPALAEIIARLLQKNPQSRYKSMAEVVAALKPLSALPPGASSLGTPRAALAQKSNCEEKDPSSVTAAKPTGPGGDRLAPACATPTARPGETAMLVVLFGAVACLAWVLARIFHLN
jgi:serine/threonine-protein kinase